MTAQKVMKPKEIGDNKTKISMLLMLMKEVQKKEGKIRTRFQMKINSQTYFSYHQQEIYFLVNQDLKVEKKTQILHSIVIHHLE